MPHKRSNSEYRNLVLRQGHGKYIPRQKYINATTRIWIEHRDTNCVYYKKHGKFYWFKMSPHCFLNKHERCPKCMRVYESYERRRPTYIRLVKSVEAEPFYNLCTTEKQFRGYMKYVWFYHRRCGHYFKMTPDDWFAMERCPYCYKSSQLERCANKHLDVLGIDYQYPLVISSINWLYDGLHIDEYINRYKIAIECDGCQHFHPYEFFGGIGKFKVQKLHDELKNMWCKHHHIILLRVGCYDHCPFREVYNKVNRALKIGLRECFNLRKMYPYKGYIIKHLVSSME